MTPSNCINADAISRCELLPSSLMIAICIPFWENLSNDMQCVMLGNIYCCWTYKSFGYGIMDLSNSRDNLVLSLNMSLSNLPLKQGLE